MWAQVVVAVVDNKVMMMTMCRITARRRAVVVHANEEAMGCGNKKEKNTKRRETN